jgi:hypothetical protein
MLCLLWKVVDSMHIERFCAAAVIILTPCFEYDRFASEFVLQ